MKMSFIAILCLGGLLVYLSMFLLMFLSLEFLPLFQVALDYIGKRGATVGVTREKRIK